MSPHPTDNPSSTALTAGPRPTTTRQRLIALTGANVRLLTRNRLTLTYAFLMPLLPLALALVGSGEPNDAQVVQSVGACLLTALLFSAFYSVLSSTVTRRDELVLKRLRTGEATDTEIISAMVLPGVAIVVGVILLIMAASPLVGLPLPERPMLLLAGTVLAAVCFATLGLWTAAWTSNAEAAQLTCLPVFALGFAGMFVGLMPEAVARVFELTPGAAVIELLAASWVNTARADLIQSLVVLFVWAVAAVVLAGRSMRWEPRA